MPRHETPKPDKPMPDAIADFAEALLSIREILDSTHKDATPGEKLVRIGWVIGNLSPELRSLITNEAQNRVTLGWVNGRKPTDW
jgi:hypothetical protein